MNPTRIIIADDHVIVSDGLQAWLDNEPSMSVVGIAYSAAEAIRLTTDLVPDVLIQDLRLPDMHGLEVVRQIRSAGLPVKIIVLSGLPENSVRDVLEAGANAFCSKGDNKQMIIEAIRWVTSGAIAPYFSPSVLKEFLSTEETLKRVGLTPTELSILKHLRLPNKDIAALLFIAEGTVRNHISSIYTKIGVSKRIEAIEWAQQNNL